MRISNGAGMVLGLGVLCVVLSTGRAQIPAPAALESPDFAPHPAAATLARVLAAPGPADFQPTGLTRNDYLKLITGNVDFFKGHQRADGAIIDPYRNRETQYATPAFALAAGLVAREASRRDLVEPASRAMTCALSALVNRRTADNHPDFYIPMLVHAHRVLKDQVAAETRASWEGLFGRINPETTYRADLRTMNWNLVSSAGEYLRRKDGLVAADRADAQLAYLEASLGGHTRRFTGVGLYEDPGVPMAYDAFGRMWLDDMMANGAYDGNLADSMRAFLRNGGLSSLLLLSPAGEWASGGRSALHQWNEAQIAMICEVHANHWVKAGHPPVAGAFKRAAHRAVEAMNRWQRPSGEMWIVKNRADPAMRFGYESYSYHSQYNLLPMAMLSMAYLHADDTIAEAPMPSETGGYVFDLRETFHKVAAAAGGYYVLIDTAADPAYNATGLQRVHRAGVAFSPLSDSTAGERSFGPASAAKIAMAPGLQWRSGQNDWRSLADFSGGNGGAGRLAVRSAELRAIEAGLDRVAFEVEYALAGTGEQGRRVTERYALSARGVEFASAVAGGAEISALRAVLPVLVSDGLEETRVTPGPGSLTITHRGSTITWTAAGNLPPLTLGDARSVNHNGYVQPATVDLPVGAGEVRWTISLRQEP